MTVFFRVSSFAATAAVIICASLSATAAQAADVIVFNSAPNDGWLYGSGNNYVPSNTEVLTTDNGDQLYLRIHNTGVVAPASVGNTYSFGLGAQQLSFDWGYDSLSPFTGTALITLTGLGGSISYNPNGPGNDNTNALGSTQNSFRFNWVAPSIGFNPLVDSTYKVNLTVNGLPGGTKSLDAYAQLGEGGPVPEPASWALMILGFGLTGTLIRRRKLAVA